MMKSFQFLLFAALLSACQNNKNIKSSTNLENDPHSYAEINEAIVNHLDLNLNVDFNTQQLTGVATWTIENKNNSDEIIFDTKDLTISKVLLDDEKEETFYTLGDNDEILGSALSIQITAKTKKVHIYYTSNKNAAAIQWVTAAQTAGKQYPFLYTQSQAILARSWIPTQDSPAIRFTYNATVKVPKEYLALMSAENPQQKNETGVYHFKQPHAIPSYLMALAVGDLYFKKIDNITGVYAEKIMLDKVAYEFADMGKMVKAAEKLYGNYPWGRFDVLVLPPSFPFGGMENPMLTFATPTVIAGDRSLVNLVAHELAHSWSGNLVTNSNWNNFWLNEGFTMYFERRISETLYGKEQMEMTEVLGCKDLHNTLKNLGIDNPDTRLNLELEDRDPDDGMTDIAYEKGYLFLKNIELLVGREKLDDFLRSHFKNNAFKSITTALFEEELEELLIKGDENLREKINAKAWIYEPGIPKNAVYPESKKFKEIDLLINYFIDNNDISKLKSTIKTTNDKLYFINTLPDTIGVNKLSTLDNLFDFTISNNAEIQCAWYVLGIKNNYNVVYPKVEEFLFNVGRRKFLEPLYKELIKTEQGKAFAKRVYQKSRPNYHSVTYNTFDKLLK